MPTGLFILIACQLLGEILRQLLRLPVPGPVVGMFLLASVLVLRQRGTASGSSSISEPLSSLETTAALLVRHMGLLFVPAGVGIVSQLDTLRNAWLPLVAGLVGSTLLSLVVTGLAMNQITKIVEVRRLARTPASDRGEPS